MIVPGHSVFDNSAKYRLKHIFTHNSSVPVGRVDQGPCKRVNIAETVRGVHCTFFIILTLLVWSVISGQANAADWTVTVRVHEANALTDNDNWGENDMYWKVWVDPPAGQGNAAFCSAEDDHDDDNDHITPGDWACTATVTGGGDPLTDITLQLWEHDTTSADDEFDIHDDPAQLGLGMTFRPASSQLSITNQPGYITPRCAPGRIRTEGKDGDDRAEIVFSVTASLAGSPDGDSDGDGLPDSWELCGVDTDGLGMVDVNLPAIGADPFRKDVFVEADWMLQPTVGAVTGHSHEPWLPSLINAWNEFNGLATVTNPTVDGMTKPNGIALHVDTGRLYAGFGIDYNGDGVRDALDLTGDGVNELPVGPSGNVDLNGDGIPDIGDLGALSGAGGGGQIPEQTILEPVNLGGTPPVFDFFGKGSSFFNIKDNNFANARANIFHYVIFGHAYRDTCSLPGAAATCLAAAPTGSSGLGEYCGTPPASPCDDFMVTLGNFASPRQTVDTDGNGVPDAAGPPPAPPPMVINGPTGLPVDGSFAQHTGTFLHELGHNLGLDHGGGDAINYKPDYLSIMNYSWQLSGLAFDLNGDSIADQLAVDLDGNGINDIRRFAYSTPGLPALNEGVPPGPFLDETTGVGAQPSALTQYTCPTPPPPSLFGAPVTRVVRGDQPIDWNCVTPSQTNVIGDINNGPGASGTLERLNGFDDEAKFQNGGLDVNAADVAPGITADQQQQLLSTTVRIREALRERVLESDCRVLRRIDFEDQDEATRIDAQYAPLATFLADDRRAPSIAGPGMRNAVPTASERHSLINHNRGETGAPLVATFDPPQRALGLSFGQAGLTRGPQERIRAVLRAYDQNDLPMGTIERALPPPNIGITEFLGAYAVFPDQLIRRIELSYEFGLPGEVFPAPRPLAEPVQIDDLVLCDRLHEVEVTPSPSQPPKFGDRSVQLRVTSVMQFEQQSTGEPGHLTHAPNPFTGLPVMIDGTPATTDASLLRTEGTTINVEAPQTVSGDRRFLHWRLGGVSFGEGLRTIPLTLLRDGVLTAVYEGRRLND